MNRLLFPGCVLALLAAVPVLRAADVAPALPVIPDRVFRLTDYAAVGDGQTLNTAAFRRAIDALEYAGGGTLVVPPGPLAHPAVQPRRPDQPPPRGRSHGRLQRQPG